MGPDMHVMWREGKGETVGFCRFLTEWLSYTWGFSAASWCSGGPVLSVCLSVCSSVRVRGCSPPPNRYGCNRLTRARACTHTYTQTRARTHRRGTLTLSDTRTHADTHTHTQPRARAYTRTHARTHALTRGTMTVIIPHTQSRKHTHTHTHTHTLTLTLFPSHKPAHIKGCSCNWAHTCSGQMRKIK